MQNSLFQNHNILKEFNADNSESLQTLYSPTVEGETKYSGFVTDLRLIINIKSIAEVTLPERNPLLSAEAIKLKEKEAIIASPKKCLSLYISTAANNGLLIGDLFLFNRYPYYYLPLLPYFTGNSTFDVAPRTRIEAKFRDAGHGLLADEDKVTVLGSVVEEVAYKQQTIIQLNPAIQLNPTIPVTIIASGFNSVPETSPTSSGLDNNFDFGNSANLSN